MPGFELAKRAAQAYRPGLEGLALIKHGLFTFGASARESYERMIALVTRAEEAIAGRRSARSSPPPKAASAAEVLPILRGVLGDAPRWVLDLRAGAQAMAVAAEPRLADWAHRGVATPDHVIRTKAHPLVLDAPSGDLAAWRGAAVAALQRYGDAYRAYFSRNAARASQAKTMLDATPRVIALPRLGLAAAARTAAEAAIVGDIAEAWAGTLLAAEAIGRFEPVGQAA